MPGPWLSCGKGHAPLHCPHGSGPCGTTQWTAIGPMICQTQLHCGMESLDTGPPFGSAGPTAAPFPRLDEGTWNFAAQGMYLHENKVFYHISFSCEVFQKCVFQWYPKNPTPTSNREIQFSSKRL